ncbi:uncharacterized protein LOC115628593 [Scaptodrosophila lebanonensis]|uniref:Uncharacterized protein LOC115628593 n=1 Tax=Drosophila lebanonensis TaxID=7225 RepID=A0A6J2U0K4_DROLE|nr:uncharacterized protein LOC115628593 [Scaptodrosophila lebanonensis]
MKRTRNRVSPHRRTQRKNQNHFLYERDFEPISKSIFSHKPNVITLIRFYSGHECLWDRNHPDYCNHDLKDNLWSWIANQFGSQVTKSDVEFEIHLLQNQAVQELQRMQTYQKMGIKFDTTFDFLDEFLFLLEDEEEEVQKTKSNPTIANAIDTIVKKSKTKICPASSNFVSSAVAKISKLPAALTVNESKLLTAEKSNLDSFCNSLKEELAIYPDALCIKTQKKIIHIINSAHAELAQRPIGVFRRFISHWGSHN